MADRPDVSLRSFRPEDAPAVHRWFNNPEATKSLMEQRGSFSLEEDEAWTRRAVNADEGEDRKYAIVVAGYEVELSPGTDTSAAQRAAFGDLYEQTMRRTDAAPHYFFGAAYFEEIF